ncbi:MULTISPECIES: glutamate racemase [unclassified Bosea (in: a-proteobacteria)]|uniref:glutamate racemase n=1 Tax=unclassified Bosea (in: a-proteobacteria) TaxID=2653178 RepID=UPI000F750312|nr:MULTISPECIES: glutamate racemase [unclassified Bosea (in: a-proteobacteria)]AZO76645.1 glutamate racemase [Bosea sp. Tri-49]RXT21476.1 glutamate racemase [Bosea sp. Tri-39]RXT31815.1 glutamate racemase [Bosea sp. Tri-54]
MQVDLLAGAGYAAPMLPLRIPTILVFDSGLGGLTVLREVMRQRPDADIVYAADDAAFPYGRLDEPALVERVLAVMERLVDRFHPDLVVIACNTASTLVLPALRARFAIPFVGTVPAVKPAAERTRSRLISVLATPGTVARDYTRDLIEHYATGCEVTLVGATQLAGLAEAALKGEPVDDAEIEAEIAPCFVDRDGRRTDVVTLACTHYPLLLPRLQRLTPWPVEWIDPAPAIARRTMQLLGPAQIRPEPAMTVAVFTDGSRLSGPAHIALAGFGLARIETEPLPLAI